MVPCALLRPVYCPVSSCLLKITVTPPPPTHTFLKWPFHTDFKKYTCTPTKGTIFFGASDEKFKNPGKKVKPTVLAHN